MTERLICFRPEMQLERQNLSLIYPHLNAQELTAVAAEQVAQRYYWQGYNGKHGIIDRMTLFEAGKDETTHNNKESQQAEGIMTEAGRRLGIIQGSEVFQEAIEKITN